MKDIVYTDLVSNGHNVISNGIYTNVNWLVNENA